jgi:hypothetical protein
MAWLLDGANLSRSRRPFKNRRLPSSAGGSGWNVSKKSREKGARAEREIVALHRELGIKAERVPLSGATGYQGNGADVDVYALGPDAAPLVCEVKARASGAGFKMLAQWLGENDALFLRRDHTQPVVVLPWRTWQRLLAEASKLPHRAGNSSPGKAVANG